MKITSGLASFAALVYLFTSTLAYAVPPVVYGADDRKDLYQVTNPLYLQLADSTVAFISKQNLAQNTSGEIKYRSSTLTLGESQELCSSESFTDQPVAAYCSGTLIGKDLILTAGHCVSNDDPDTLCKNTKLVFGFNVKARGAYPKSFSEPEVYSCKKIVHREYTPRGVDFAIIKLDRPVVNHAALKLNLQRTSVPIEAGTPLVLIGHPSGLPTKVADGATVRNPNGDGFFIANTDSFGGNSGSAVFNAKSGEIEGILVRGENDYVKTAAGCKVTYRCTDTGCYGESVTKIANVIPYLKGKI